MVSMNSTQCPLSKHFLLIVLQQINDLLIIFKVNQKELGEWSPEPVTQPPTRESEPQWLSP